MSQNVCIYFSDTGGGHRSAGEAIEAAIHAVLSQSGNDGAVNIIKDTIAEKCHPINRFFAQTYNYLLRHHQPLMKYYYWFLHAIRPEKGLNELLTKDYFDALLGKDQPSVIVSTHPMQQYVISGAIHRLGLHTKLIVVVTDPNAELWRAWACPAADLTIVPNDMVKNRLVQFGLPEDRVVSLGMAVHPEFLTPPTMSRAKFLSHLGLSVDALTICINAGWAGGGNMLKIYEELSRVQRPIQALFLCGHNTRMYDQAMAAAAASDVPTAVLPFHDCMADLMASVDLMVTKAGGLTTYQALARRLPLVFDVITPPMPQEHGTIDMLQEHALASSVRQPSDIIDIIEMFQPQLDRLQSKLPSAYEFDLTDGGVFEIARRVLESCAPPIVVKTNAVPQSDAEVPACDSQPKSTANRAAGET